MQQLKKETNTFFMIVLQNKGNRLCYVDLIYDVCEVKAG